MSRADDATNVKDSAADVAQLPVAAVYAKALLEAARKANSARSVLEELDSLVDDVLSKLPGLRDVLLSAMANAEDKERILDRALRGRASTLFLNSLKVMARHDRLDLLPLVRKQAHELFDLQEGRVEVLVASAVKLDDSGRRALIERLRKQLGAEPRLVERVEPDLLGGLVVRVGDVVYDGSVATQLKQLRSQMLNRSIHEIQSRRDRFGNPTGN